MTLLHPRGPLVQGFELALQKQLKASRPPLALSSGTAALHLALSSLGVKKGDLVAVSSLTFIASANPIRYLGAKPLFIDVEENSWGMDPLALQSALWHLKGSGNLSRLRACILVHPYGRPAGQVQAIKTICDYYRIPLIEDAAQTLGSKHKGQALGTIGDIGILSFNANKILTCGGGGGALTTPHETIRRRALYLSQQAKENRSYYHHTELGYNYGLSGIQAQYGLKELSKLPELIAQRKTIQTNYYRLLKDQIDLQIPQVHKNDFSNDWLPVFTFPDLKESMATIHKKLGGPKSGFQRIFKPLHLQPLFAGAGYFGQKQAQNLFDQALVFPYHYGLKIQAQKSYVNQFLRSSLSVPKQKAS